MISEKDQHNILFFIHELNTPDILGPGLAFDSLTGSLFLNYAEGFMPSISLLAKNRLKILFGCSDRLDSEILYKNVKDCRADKCGKRGAEPDVLYPKVKQR